MRALPQMTPCGVSGTSKYELLCRLFEEIETRVFVGIFKGERGKMSFHVLGAGQRDFESPSSVKSVAQRVSTPSRLLYCVQV